MTMLPKMRRKDDKNLTYAAMGIAGMAKAIIDLKAELAAALANQRTPGTMEVCSRVGLGDCPDYAGRSQRPQNCPVFGCGWKSAKQQGIAT